LTGPGIWGEPDDRAECIRVLRRAVELGVDFIDTADSYGPYVSENLIREALHPYDGVTVATKGGLTRHGPNSWPPLGRPEYLRQQALLSMRRLGLDHIDLFQLHRIDPQVPLEDQVGELVRLQEEGKIAAIGLSQVTTGQLERARSMAEIVTVQNRYNLVDRSSADVLDLCTRAGIGFIPWAPVAAGDLARPGGPAASIADAHGATVSQVALAWLLARSPVVLPIPGTSRVAHLEENLAAADLILTEEEISILTEVAD
jgi:aryl-alcohol dehydrogenase-like predicted oxidoreductase